MNKKKGVYNLEKYYQEEKANIFRRRKIGCRAAEVIFNIERNIGLFSSKKILDIGASDCKLLKILKERYQSNEYYGLEYAYDLLNLSGDTDINKICGNGTMLPVIDECFDIVVSTATLEHVENPDAMIKEIYRSLKKGGIVILTTPHKFWIKVAEIVGVEPRNEHYVTFNLKELREIFIKNGFNILYCYKFMFFPFRYRYEKMMENILTKLGLGFLMVNQIIVAEK